MKRIIAAGKTNHCGRCHRKTMFYLKPDGLFYCEACGLMLVEAQNVSAVFDAAYGEYKRHIPHGNGANDTAVAAARTTETAKNKELTAALINMRKAAAHNYPGKKEKQNGD